MYRVDVHTRSDATTREQGPLHVWPAPEDQPKWLMWRPGWRPTLRVDGARTCGGWSAVRGLS